jgi:hypothetical protein
MLAWISLPSGDCLRPVSAVSASLPAVADFGFGLSLLGIGWKGTFRQGRARRVDARPGAHAKSRT